MKEKANFIKGELLMFSLCFEKTKTKWMQFKTLRMKFFNQLLNLNNIRLENKIQKEIMRIENKK